MRNLIQLVCKVVPLVLVIILGWSCDFKRNRSFSPSSSFENNRGMNKKVSSEKELYYKAIFSEPVEIKKGKPSTIIVDKLIQLIDGAQEKSDIFMNIYDFRDEDLASALIKAANRGVNVRVLVDSSNNRSFQRNELVYRMFKKSFDNSPGRNSGVFGFYNDISINHHKHAIFSKTKFQGTSLNHVVFNTSSNFNQIQYEVLQDATIIGESKELYDAFLENWFKMFSLRKSGTKNKFEYSSYTLKNREIEARFLPLRKNGMEVDAHPFSEFLKEATKFQIDTIRIGMSLWSDEDEQVEIAKSLLLLQSENVYVEIILRFKDSKNYGNGLLSLLKLINEKGGKVFFLPNEKIIHSKYMMIKGEKDEAPLNWLIAGSTNFTNNAVWRAYDLVLFIKNEQVFKEYEKNFIDIIEEFSSAGKL